MKSKTFVWGRAMTPEFQSLYQLSIYSKYSHHVDGGGEDGSRDGKGGGTGGGFRAVSDWPSCSCDGKAGSAFRCGDTSVCGGF